VTHKVLWEEFRRHIYCYCSVKCLWCTICPAHRAVKIAPTIFYAPVAILPLYYTIPLGYIERPLALRR
jgi:hypothetical protein